MVRGKYKGRLGHVSNMRQDKCFVGMPSLGKKIAIHKDDLVLIDTRALHRQASAFVSQAAALLHNGGSANASSIANNGSANAAAAAAARFGGTGTGTGTGTGAGAGAGYRPPGVNDTPLAVDTPLLTGDRTPMIVPGGGDSGGGNDGDEDAWDPDAEAYQEHVTWAHQGVVATMDGFGDNRFTICENATSKFDDQRVIVKAQSSGQTRTVQLSKLHFLNPNGTGQVIILSGDRAGTNGIITRFNPSSTIQTVTIKVNNNNDSSSSGTDGSGDNNNNNNDDDRTEALSVKIDDMAIFDPRNDSH